MAAKRYGLACDQTWIVVTCGASAGLAAVILALTAPGEGVLVPDPGYPAYAKLVQNLGRVPHRYLAARVDLAPDPAAIEASIRPGDRMLLWNSPSNPLGFVATRAVTETIAEFARRHRLALVSDEVYEDLVYEGVHSSPMQTSVKNTVTLHSFSKSYGMAGWRVGYVLALPSLAKEIARAHWSLAMSVSAVGQAAALGALAAPASYLPEVRSTLRRNRDRVCDRLSDYGIPHRRPNGAFFVWLDISATGRSAAEFVSQCLEENAVALTPGTAFGPGGEGFVRLSFGGAGVELDEGVDRLGHSYREWSGSGALPVAKAIV
jgi:aspartate/methionine/tyrosine aminotransferase